MSQGELPLDRPTKLKQRELFPSDNLGDGRLRTYAQRRRFAQEAAKRLARRWHKPETREEHDHAENGGTVYVKNSFREA